MNKKLLFSLLFITAQSFASGMVPETSVLLVDSGKGEATMNVTNTDNYPSLLYTKIVELPEGSKSSRLIVTQPVVRVEAGQTQKVRFMLQSDKPLQQEEMKRVTFEGIPPKEKGTDKMKVTIRQDMPVIIHPAGLAEDLTPWKHLVWTKKGNQLEISNPSDYVVRMAAMYTGLPSGKGGTLDKAYILPHTSVTVKLAASGDTKVEFYPASRYGYKGERYTTSIK
ncbi:fimbria/pilus chaperone family protein [Enterobacter soli]|uniref:fimbria/pilus chaperone family protein n=1 Tax=Enterobacter soli TaxID=885040 RepID=UPI0034CF0578